jgi:NAD(P)-dependent dehydrogenase (short-subunit alcohol dehydrogenase family)
VNLSGQVAVVTGGNGGIGFGMATGLAAAGADVAVWARDEAKSAAAIEQLTRRFSDGRFLAVTCDVSDRDQIDAAVATTVSDLGHIDACVANAGVSSAVGFLDLSREEWRRVLGINLDGTFFTLQSVARQMVTQGAGGALVAVASTSAVHGAPLNAHYATSKTAILGLVRSAAVALARHGIRVNALVPGWTVTDLARGAYENERFREVTVGRTPVRRWGDPTEFGTVAAYLCDKSLTYHTGDAVTIDGGYTVF